MRTRAVVLTFLLLATAAACGGSGGKSASSPTTTSSATTTTLPRLTTATAQAALLTLTELPGSFADQGWQDGTLKQGPSCALSATDPGVDTTVPASVVVGLAAKDATGVAFVREEVRAYDNSATAASAFDAMSRGETCANGTNFRDDGTTSSIQIDAPVDVKAELSTDAATKWLEHTSGFDNQVVAARVGAVVLRFDTFTNIGAFPAFLGSPLDLPAKALAKLKTALPR